MESSNRKYNRITKKNNKMERTGLDKFLKLRYICLVMAAAVVVHTLNYGTGVSSTFRTVMTSSDLYFNPVVKIEEKRIYPIEFQMLEKPPSHLSINASLTPEQKNELRQAFHQSNRDAIYSLLLLPTDEEYLRSRGKQLSTDTVMQWGGEDYERIHHFFHRRHRQGLYEFHDVFGTLLDEKDALIVRKSQIALEAAWGKTNGKPRVINEHNLCHAFNHAKDIADFKTPHILVTHLNENWGGLSSFVKNRTFDWGRIIKEFEEEKMGSCNPYEVEKLYLDSPNTLAVFTTQHQALYDHPKIHSIPIGVANSLDGGLKLLRNLRDQKRMFNDTSKQGDARTQFLMINNNPTETRKPQIDAVLHNFEQSGHPSRKGIKNTYGTYKGAFDAQRIQYQTEIWKSKFILCPSGIGWDSYRIWESMVLGAIPVIEKHKYKYNKVIYPESSGRLPKLVEWLDEPSDREKLAKYVAKHNATLVPIEYLDGWRKTLDDLPVVWVDDTYAENLTPQFLEAQYDAIVAQAGEFRYEKLTSLYWIQFMESFMFTDPRDAALRQQAMDTLSETWNDPSPFDVDEVLHRYDGVKENVDEEEDFKEDENNNLSDVSEDHWQRVLSFVIYLQSKVVGVILIFVAIRRWDPTSKATQDQDS